MQKKNTYDIFEKNKGGKLMKSEGKSKIIIFVIIIVALLAIVWIVTRNKNSNNGTQTNPDGSKTATILQIHR